MQDSNLGLAKQCLVSLHKKNIQRLTKTFLTLSLEDMTERVKLSSVEEAESYILRMVSVKLFPCKVLSLMNLYFRLKMKRYLHQSIKRMEWLSF